MAEKSVEKEMKNARPVLKSLQKETAVFLRSEERREGKSVWLAV